MYKNIIIGVLLIAATVFAYLYKTKNKEVVDLTIENARQARETAFVDSINYVLKNTNIELDSANKVYIEKNANIKWALEQVEDELNDMKQDLKNMSIESIAALVIKTHLGDVYKIKKINDTTFVAFQEKTVRHIAEQDAEFEAEKQRSVQYRKDIASKDTLIKMQAKAINIFQTANDTLSTRYSAMNTELHESNVQITDLTNEIDVLKGHRRILVGIGGVLLTIIILL